MVLYKQRMPYVSVRKKVKQCCLKLKNSSKHSDYKCWILIMIQVVVLWEEL